MSLGTFTGAVMQTVVATTGVSGDPKSTNLSPHVQKGLNITGGVVRQLVGGHGFGMIPSEILPGHIPLPEFLPQVETLLQCLQRSGGRIGDNAIGAINYGNTIGIVNGFDSFFYDPSTNSFMTGDLGSGNIDIDYNNFKRAIDTVIQLCSQGNGYS